MSKKTKEKLADRVVLGFLAVVGLVVLGAGVFLVRAVFGDASNDEAAREYSARHVCEEFVKDQLKAPSTAKFSETSASPVGEEGWVVRGAVDSQNSFGAMIRNTYVCEVEHTTGDNWHLVRLDSTEN